MRNILSYLKDFGQCSFQEKPFNEVDSLILSQLSYLNLELCSSTIEEDKESISLISYLNEGNIDRLCKNTLDNRRNKKMLRILKDTTRYQGLYINYYQNQFNTAKIEQFYAITFLFQDFVYLAYRGTDLSLLGWHENFNMAFMDVIPSQEDAAKYLEAVGNKTQKDIYLGGHSKGGNLAVYAALYSCSNLRKRIIKIFDHDGPGFTSNIFETDAYLEIADKIEKTTCEQAIVGILLHHSEKMKFVDARSIGIFQHDPYNWKITKDGNFKLVKKAKLFSKIFEKTVNTFIQTTDIEDRKLFLDIFFKISVESDHEIIFDINRHPFRYMKRIHKNYKKIPADQKDLIKCMLKRYRKLWNQNLKYYLKRKIRFKER